jgi:hypothetical protein
MLVTMAAGAGNLLQGPYRRRHTDTRKPTMLIRLLAAFLAFFSFLLPAASGEFGDD